MTAAGRASAVALLLMLGACGTAPKLPGAETSPSASAASPPRPGPGDRAQWEPLTEPFVATKVRVNDDVACAISTEGKVACWGDVEPDDASTRLDRRAGMSKPHLLVGIEGAVDVVAEWFYVCVAQREDAGEGRCFSRIDLGDRVPPRFPSPPVELVADQYGICARMRDGSAGCVNLQGKLTLAKNVRGATHLACDGDGGCCAIVGDGVSCFGEAPPKLPALRDVTELALGREEGCARTRAGGATCWGDAAALSRPSGVRAVAQDGEGDTCVVGTDGSLKCQDDERAKEHVAHLSEDCVLHTDGSVSCSGYNEHGERGDGALMLAPLPVLVPKLDQVTDLNVAHGNVGATKRDGSLWCWGPKGAEDRGSVGGPFITGQYIAGCRNIGTALRCDIPMMGGGWERESIAPDAASIKTAAIHRDGSVCVVDGAGAVQCRHGMSEGGVDDRWTPLPAPAPVVDLQPLAVGFCARHADGRVSCFVDRRYDNDDDFLETLPTGRLELVPDVKDVAQLVTGQHEACVIKKDTSVWCFNADGPNRFKPWEMTALKGATSLGANHLHTCAVLSGDVWCWGDGFMGQLGDGVGTNRIEPAKAPMKVKAPFKAVEVGTGRDSSCALDDQGKVWCWGANTYGQLGHPRAFGRTTDGTKVVGIGPR